MKSLLSLVLLTLATSSCSGLPAGVDGQSSKGMVSTVVLASEVDWQKLNPARGDKSPQAATLWGDRNGTSATGFLFHPVAGFESPPHIHNVTYRGVVIRGVVHNDDPQAEEMWMPGGSFWTQPKGQVHITSAMGDDTLAYIEIDRGPYLVLPTDEAFDTGERPVNVDRSNLVWVDAPNAATAGGAKVAYLWGDLEGEALNGRLIKMPNGFAGTLRSSGLPLRAVVIQGAPQVRVAGATEFQTLPMGSYFASEEAAVHEIRADGECILYVRMKGQFDVASGR